MTYVDEIHDNEFSDERKCRWVSECEARIWSGVMLLPPEGFPGYRWEYDADQVLLMPPPYDELYLVYLSAKIYLAYHEAQNYQNAMAAFNKLYDQTSIWYAKAYDPAHGGRMEIPEVPTIVQGETATVLFSLPYGADALGSLSAVVTAEGGTLLSLTREEMEVRGDEAQLTLTQEQSLALPAGVIHVAIAGTDLDGQRFEAWPPLAIRVVATAFQEVIG